MSLWCPFILKKIFLSVKCILEGEGGERGATPAPPMSGALHTRAGAGAGARQVIDIHLFNFQISFIINKLKCGVLKSCDFGAEKSAKKAGGANRQCGELPAFCKRASAGDCIRARGAHTRRLFPDRKRIRAREKILTTRQKITVFFSK